MAGATSAAAQTFHIKEFEFERGKWSFESINAVQDRFSPTSDRVRGGHELGLGYGLTDWYFPKLLVSFDKPADGGWLAQRAILENIFLLRPLATGTDGVGLAWFQSIEGRLDRRETNATLFGPIITAQSGLFSLSLNPFFERTFGANHLNGLAFNGNWQARHEIVQHVRIGFEGYSTIEDVSNWGPVHLQQHRVGPMVLLDAGLLRPAVPKDVAGDLELGVLFGLTEATPGVTGKANLNIRF